uniref:Uncharacterized protein n=1 Tax=Panagrolaimus sp. PS1159 TaxID=55785 RepID=A0AC35GB69_9BILA
MDKKLDGRTESYRAATMYRIDPVEESIPVATTTTTNEMIKESPEVIRTRCCGLCSKKTKKNSSKQNSKQSSPSLQTAVALNK